MSRCPAPLLYFFFFNATATTEIYTLSLHDALPISERDARARNLGRGCAGASAARGAGEAEPEAAARGDRGGSGGANARDRKSTRLNSSHSQISYAVFCLKKKKNKTEPR